LQDNDIGKILDAKNKMSSNSREQVKGVLMILLISYYLTDDTDGNNGTALLLQRHYAQDATAKKYLNSYRL